jgi:hypothetical protein
MGSAPIPGPAARKLLIGHSALEGQSQGRFDHAEWCIVPPCNAPCSNHSWPQHCSYRSGASRTSFFLMKAPGEDGPIVRSALSKKFQHGADHPAGGGRRAASHPPNFVQKILCLDDFGLPASGAFEARTTRRRPLCAEGRDNTFVSLMASRRHGAANELGPFRVRPPA